MRTTIDAAGRLVIPKAIRERLGFGAGTEVEVKEVDGRLEISVPPVEKRVERRGGRVLIVAADGTALPPLGDDLVRATLEAVRERR